MSVPVTFQYAPADPDCCVRTCQDVIDLIQASLTGSAAVDGVIVGPDMPSADYHSSLWLKTSDNLNTTFLGILIWSTASGTWIDFTFDPATITPGDECTLLGSALSDPSVTVQHRTMSQVIDCIDDKQIPCSKIDFGIVPSGGQFQTWQIVITANADSTAAGRIEFDVTWTSVTCGVGRKFVTEAPVTGGSNYTIDVCMPSDAANITITNLKGVQVPGGWSNTTVDCTPDSCATTSGLPTWKNSGALVIPTTAGSAGQVTWAHGLIGKPQFVEARFVCTTNDGGYVVGEDIDAFSVIENNGDKFYQIKRDVGNVYFFCSSASQANAAFINASTGSPNQQFTPASWALYISAMYLP